MEKTNRPQRNRRVSRRTWQSDNRPTKMLFTPEKKRFLKDWLVRRRDNPYPNRDEKKRLAIETGLTYTQICNWFANWRRKLKNSEREKAEKSWGHLIKNYNTRARGNVEQFSISSEDSIWEEEQQQQQQQENLDSMDDDEDLESHDEYSSGSYIGGFGSDGNYACADIYRRKFNIDIRKEIQDTSLLGHLKTVVTSPSSSNNTPKYKQQIIEKYLRDSLVNSSKVQQTLMRKTNSISINNSGTELNKWLVSAVKFTPNKNNYHIEWNNRNKQKQCTVSDTLPKVLFTNVAKTIATIEELPFSVHHKDELDAAEALTNLAFNYRQRMTMTTTTTTINS